MSIRLEDLRRIAEIEFDQIVLSTETLGEKLRVFLSDGSYIDAWVARQLPDRFGFHWERRHIDGTFYRYDNFPNTAWRSVTTYPLHFHDGDQNRVIAAPFSGSLPDGFRDFMRMIERRLQAA